jgi:hypothetical protein
MYLPEKLWLKVGRMNLLHQQGISMGLMLLY